MQIKQTQLKIIFWGCVIAVFVLSCMPGSSAPLFAIQHLDKLAHFTAFFALSILLLLAYQFKNPFLWTALLMALFGLLIEIVQLYIPNRMFSAYDIFADIFGIISAFMAYKLIGNKLTSY